jgi:hypothetical protein
MGGKRSNRYITIFVWSACAILICFFVFTWFSNTTFVEGQQATEREDGSESESESKFDNLSPQELTNLTTAQQNEFINEINDDPNSDMPPEIRKFIQTQLKALFKLPAKQRLANFTEYESLKDDNNPLNYKGKNKFFKKLRSGMKQIYTAKMKDELKKGGTSGQVIKKVIPLYLQKMATNEDETRVLSSYGIKQTGKNKFEFISGGKGGARAVRKSVVKKKQK